MNFEEVLYRAQTGDKEAVLQILEMFRPLLIKNSLSSFATNLITSSQLRDFPIFTHTLKYILKEFLTNLNYRDIISSSKNHLFYRWSLFTY